MNASLQNPYMLAHPPLLYLGYVGLTIPFAFAMGALLSGRTDERWIVVTRRWTLAAWTFLGVGQLIGSHWAYVEIGWGGYYAWDPVENAALMPWLAATAFLHSVMIQEKRGMLKVWNMVLVALAFNLSIFGTFLTRSGVINSIHSFSQSPLGGWFLGFIVICVAFSVVLIYVRLPLLRTKTKLESLVSREATFLYNNLLLVAFCLTILWGVMYPLLTEAVRGETRSVSKPYYNFFLHSFGLPLLLLMGIGPLVAWRRASLRALGQDVPRPFAVAVVTGGVLLALGFGSSMPGPARVHVRRVRRRVDRARVRARDRARHALSAVVAGALVELVGEPAALRRLHRPRLDPDARDRHRGSSAYQTVRERGLAPGQSMRSRATRSRTSSSTTAGGERGRDARGGRRRRAAARTSRRCTRARTTIRSSSSVVERGRRSTTIRGTSAICSRSPTRSTRSRIAVPEGAREAAREPHLGCRLPVRLRCARRDVAGRRRAAEACRALRGGRRRGMTLALVLAALLAVLVVAFVAGPFCASPRPASDRLDELSELERRRLQLTEERDRALEALKELEFDHRTGKVSDDDYRALVGPLRRRAAETLRALEPRAEARHERIPSSR